MADTIFCGSAREKNSKYGVFHKLSFSRKDIEALVAQLGQGDWVNVNMFRRRDQKDGVTHYLVIDTWKPAPEDEQEPPF